MEECLSGPGEKAAMKEFCLDQGYMTDEYLTPDYFRWLYTAFTRATGTLYLVNYPEEQIV